MKIKSAFAAPILVIIAMLMLVGARFIKLDASAYRENICLAVIVIQFAALVVPSAFYIKLKGEGFVKRMRIRPMGIEKLLVTLLAVIVLVLGDTVIRLFLYQTGIIESNYSVYYAYMGGVQPGVLYSLVTFALVPAVCEELLFRSVLCAEYESEGVITAAIISAALYGMYGMSIGYFPIYFFAGLIFALVMYLTRSVFAAIICHLFYNLYEIGLGDTVKSILTKPQSTGFLIFAVAAAFLIALAAFFGECERIYYGYALKGIEAEYVKKSSRPSLRRFIEMILTPTFLLCVLIFVIAAVQFGSL